MRNKGKIEKVKGESKTNSGQNGSAIDSCTNVSNGKEESQLASSDAGRDNSPWAEQEVVRGSDLVGKTRKEWGKKRRRKKDC
jgi:hypothetical protein